MNRMEKLNFLFDKIILYINLPLVSTKQNLSDSKRRKKVKFIKIYHHVSKVSFVNTSVSFNTTFFFKHFTAPALKLILKLFGLRYGISWSVCV